MKTINATLHDVANAVYYDDNCPENVNKKDLRSITDKAMFRLAMTALGDRQVQLELGNGFRLNITVEQIK